MVARTRSYMGEAPEGAACGDGMMQSGRVGP
jgi:hypothetical protein